MSDDRCLVVGAGVVGLTVALALVHEGWEVECVDDGGADGAATAASGAMLGVLGETTALPADGREQLAVELRLRAGARYAAWLGELGESAPPVVAGRGTFVAAGAGRASDRAAVLAMESLAHRHGLPAQRVAPEEVPGLAPGGQPPQLVLHLADEGWVDSASLCTSLRAACTAAGRVAFTQAEVAHLVLSGDRVVGVRTQTGVTLEADEVVVCAGAGTRDVLDRTAGLAHGLPEVVRAKGVGLVLTPRADEAPASVLRTPNREFACGLHVVPRAGGDVYVGATNRASRYPAATGGVTADEVAYLVDGVGRDVTASVAGWDVRALGHGQRALPTDRLPLVGRTRITGLSVAAGTYREGVLLAPLVAGIVAAELAGTAPAPGNRLSPVPGVRLDVPPPDPASVARDGLAQLPALLAESRDLRWRQRLEPAQDALRSVADGAEDETEATHRATALLRRYPLVEMVPEILLELAQDPLVRAG